MIRYILFLSLFFVQSFCQKRLCSPSDPTCHRKEIIKNVWCPPSNPRCWKSHVRNVRYRPKYSPILARMGVDVPPLPEENDVKITLVDELSPEEDLDTQIEQRINLVDFIPNFVKNTVEKLIQCLRYVFYGEDESSDEWSIPSAGIGIMDVIPETYRFLRTKIHKTIDCFYEAVFDSYKESHFSEYIPQRLFG